MEWTFHVISSSGSVHPRARIFSMASIRTAASASAADGCEVADENMSGLSGGPKSTTQRCIFHAFLSGSPYLWIVVVTVIIEKTVLTLAPFRQLEPFGEDY